MKDAIGIFDSGVGGLSVARAVRNLLPNENIIYVADRANAPYGDKEGQFIDARSVEITEFLISQGAKSIVVACNTATVSSLALLRTKFDIPIIGVEPGVKPATLRSASRKIGVLATSRTIKSEAFNRLVQEFSKEAEILLQACPGLVELIERQMLDSPEVIALLHTYIDPLLERGVDTIVLGCTHYAFIVPILTKITNGQIDIVTTHDAVAAQVRVRLQNAGLLTDSASIGSDHFFTTLQEIPGQTLFNDLWGTPVLVKLLS